MIQAETKGFDAFSAFLRSTAIEEAGAKAVASASGRFVEFLKSSRFDELFKSHGGKKGKHGNVYTRDTIKTYRYARRKEPTYMVMAGVGISGSLNYLAGLYRGQATTKSGKVFSYARKRDLVKGGWKAWGGKGKLEAAGEAALERMIADAEKKI